MKNEKFLFEKNYEFHLLFNNFCICSLRAPRAQPTIDCDESSLHSAVSTEDLDLRDPSQLVVGAPNTLLTSWRHHPNQLVSSSVQYVAQVSSFLNKVLHNYKIIL